MAQSDTTSELNSSHSSSSAPKVPFMKRVFSKKGPSRSLSLSGSSVRPLELGTPLAKTAVSSGRGSAGKGGSKSGNTSPDRPSTRRTTSSGTAKSYVDNDGTSIFDEADFDSSTVAPDVTDDSSVSSHDSGAASISKNHNFHDKVEIPADDSEAATPSAASASAFFRTLAWEGLTYESLLFPSYMRLSSRNRHISPQFNKLFLAQELNQLLNGQASADSDGESPHLDDAPIPDMDGHSDTKPASSQREILVMEWSRDGRYLATAGRDQVIKIWKVVSSPLAKLENERKVAGMSPRAKGKDKVFENAPVFHQFPVREFRGHSDTILALDWSKNNFLISGGMDRTARLWHVERSDCLHTFKHSDFVTTVNFHPNDDRFFLSGSLDNRVRLWSILESNVAYCKDMGDDILITATCFTPDGEHCMVGSFSGMVSVLETKGLHLMTKFNVKKRTITSLQLSNDNKVTGIKVFANKDYKKSAHEEHPFARWNVLITTNDSKIRLVDSHLKRLVTRFKGLSNSSSSIVASMTEDQNYIIAGSEDHWCYIWENNNTIINKRLKSAMRDLLHDGVTQVHEWEQKHKKYTHLFHDSKLMRKLGHHKDSHEDQTKDYVSNENGSYISFHAHHSSVNVAKFAPESAKALLEMSDDVIYDLMKRGNKCGFMDTQATKKDSKDSSSKSESEELHRLGNIIVTTDQAGLIRVFRQDSAYKVRKELIEKYRRAVGRGGCDSGDKQLCGRKEQALALKKKLLKHRTLSPGREGVSSIKDILGRGHRGSSCGDLSPRTASFPTMRPTRPILPLSSDTQAPVNRSNHLSSMSGHPVFNNEGLEMPLFRHDYIEDEVSSQEYVNPVQLVATSMADIKS